MALSSKTPAGAAEFVLPVQLSGKTDINRLLRELEVVEEDMIARPGKEAGVLNVTSLMNQMAQANGYKLSEQAHRRHLAEQLTKIRDHAPAVHISFASEPSPNVTETILTWLRTNVHRYTLIQVGLQPAIAAGCVLRTPNKIFDLSLGASLQKQTPYLLELLKGAALDAPAPGASATAGKS